jgi:hypothetical protein
MDKARFSTCSPPALSLFGDRKNRFKSRDYIYCWQDCLFLETETKKKFFPAQEESDSETS